MNGENEPSPSGESVIRGTKQEIEREGEDRMKERVRSSEKHLCMLRLYLVWSMQIHELADILTSG